MHSRTVEPGGLGVCFDPPTATIDNVKDDGQGHALGVKPGWRMNEMDGNPYTLEERYTNIELPNNAGDHGVTNEADAHVDEHRSAYMSAHSCGDSRQ